MRRKATKTSKGESPTLFAGTADIAAPSTSNPPAQPVGSRWTPAQWAGISSTGRSLLVSAAAGSGKTAVLAERCAFLVCDAPRAHRADVNELLVVTFTEAAAAEMRTRIQKSLRARIADSRGSGDAAAQHLQRQLALVEHAQISTLHSFCARLLRQHFHQLKLDPNFAILDGDEAKLMRSEIARALFDDRYADDESGRFQSLVNAYADGYDERLIAEVISAHETLRSVIDPEAWRARALSQIVEAIEKPMAVSTLGQRCLALIRAKISSLHARTADAIATLSRMDGFGKYITQLQELAAVMTHWLHTLESSGLDALAETALDLQLPKAPTLASTVPGKDLAKSLLDSIKKELKPGAMLDILRFTEAQWRDGLAATRPFVEEFLSLIDEFAHRYSATKQSQRVVDFTDLERFAMKLLTSDSHDGKLVPSIVARSCHERFKHVLVDEYQDINEVQDAILSLVSRECLAPDQETNLFCVGDVKQSIYRFRLADPGRFLTKDRRFRQPGQFVGQVIDLQANFRSRGPLLTVVNGVFQRVMTEVAAGIEYDESHHLVPGLEYPPGDDGTCFSGAPIEMHLLPAKIDAAALDGNIDTAGEDERDRTAREAMFVARRIRALMGLDGCPRMNVVDRDADGSLAHRPIRYSDIVILLRSMRVKGDEYADVIRAHGVPVHSESGTGYFESTEVRDLLALLSLLDNLQQDIPMAAVLRSPLAGLPEPEDCLARIAAHNNQLKHRLPFHKAVVHYANHERDDLAANLTAFLRKLNDWRDRARQRPLAELIWAIYHETGYLAFVEGLPNGEQRVANLIDLHERGRQFGGFRRQGLKRFLDFLDQLRASSDLGQPSIASEADHVVRIMTVHGSKGLEFPVVIIPDLGKRINLGDCSGNILLDRDAGLALSVVDEEREVRYPSLATVVVQDQLLRQSLAEEMRVLYVAMTRAREHLILVGSCGDSATDNWRSRWGSHAGAFPCDEIIGARCMLDWLGPAWAALEATPGAIEMTAHPADEVAGWVLPETSFASATQWQKDRAALKPISGVVERSPLAKEIIQRVTERYEFERYSTLPASDAVTNIAKEGRATFGGQSASRTAIVEMTPLLSVPRIARTDHKPTAAEIGSATHAVLQRIDFARICDTDDVRLQIQGMVSSRLLSQRDADAVDLETIAWFIETELGQRMKMHASHLHRELAVYAAHAQEGLDTVPPDPMDRLMIRSRIDALMELPDGSVEIIDYKTDRVTPATVDARAAFYDPQMTLYRQAVSVATRRNVRGVHLVFLAPRIIRSRE